MFNPVLAQKLLHTLDGISRVLQQIADSLEQLHIRRAIQPATAAPLHGLDLGEFQFPEAQYVLLDAKLLRHLADIAKCFHRLDQGTSPSNSKMRFFYSAALRRISPVLMRCFMMLLGRNTKTLRGVIGTSCPVLGLRPIRWPFWRMPKEPKEDSFTALPAARLVEISCRIISTRSCDSLRGKPTFCTTASARSARVSVLPPMVFRPSPALCNCKDANGGFAL